MLCYVLSCGQANIDIDEYRTTDSIVFAQQVRVDAIPSMHFCFQLPAAGLRRRALPHRQRHFTLWRRVSDATKAILQL